MTESPPLEENCVSENCRRLEALIREVKDDNPRASAAALAVHLDREGVRVAEEPDKKGAYGGNCFRAACQKPGAHYYNTGTRLYYCRDCAQRINQACSQTICVSGNGAPETLLPGLVGALEGLQGTEAVIRSAEASAIVTEALRRIQP